MKLEQGVGAQWGRPPPAHRTRVMRVRQGACYLARDQSAMFHNSLSQPVILMPLRLAAKAEG